MRFRTAFLIALAAITATVATAATETHQAAPAQPVAGVAAPQTGASPGDVLGLLAGNPAPLFLTGNTCGACSDALCVGKSVGATCGSASTGVCVSTIQCSANQKTCRCSAP